MPISRLHSAVELVITDIVAVLGAGAVTVVFRDRIDNRTLDELASSRPFLIDWLTSENSADAYAFVDVSEGARGLTDVESLQDAELVVRLADALQLLIMESRTFFGAAFPPCPRHPGTPLWADLIDGRAMWVCKERGAVATAIGTLAARPRPRPTRAARSR